MKKHNHENHEKENRERNEKLFGAVLLAIRSCGELEKAKADLAKASNEREFFRTKAARFEQAHGKLSADLDVEKRRSDTIQIECNAWRVTVNKMTDERNHVIASLNEARELAAFWRMGFACLAVANVVTVAALVLIRYYFGK